MKRTLLVAVSLVLLLFLLPVLLLKAPAEEGEIGVLPATPTPVSSGGAEEDSRDSQTVVRVLLEDGQVEEMTLADYLWSVTAAEMPASFEPEALKAQVVTARTYTAWKMLHGEENHPDADVCTDVNCCQAYLSPEDAAAAWGDAAQEYTEKLWAAVTETDGEVITYEGQPIQAVFFSSSAGRTEDAVEVWGSAVPYLVGVDSPEGEDVPNYHTEVTLSAQEFQDIFLAAYPQADLSGTPERWFGKSVLTASGRVSSMEVGGVSVTGTALRALFSLRSAAFTVEAAEDSVTFQVTGYGHGVGMSQYGANALAQQGMDYQEIVKWYYTGVEVIDSF
ncbi:MAG: stage II sporulation protein D [Oscillospiraceae bacterium]|nr:stage II sporulation protein D [Oscillospiraceae bacterium]